MMDGLKATVSHVESALMRRTADDEAIKIRCDRIEETMRVLPSKETVENIERASTSARLESIRVNAFS